MGFSLFKEHWIIRTGRIIDRLQLQPGFAAEDNAARFAPFACV
jgi:hypothetical protein